MIGTFPQFMYFAIAHGWSPTNQTWGKPYARCRARKGRPAGLRKPPAGATCNRAKEVGKVDDSQLPNHVVGSVPLRRNYFFPLLGECAGDRWALDEAGTYPNLVQCPGRCAPFID